MYHEDHGLAASRDQLMEDIVDELLHGDPEHALNRLEAAGYELEDLLL